MYIELCEKSRMIKNFCIIVLLTTTIVYSYIDTIVSNCDDTVGWTGGAFVDNGNGTSKGYIQWDSSIDSSVSLMPIVRDFSLYSHISVWIYSDYLSQKQFTMNIISDNPKTIEIDSYQLLLDANFKNWKNIVIPLDSFTIKGSPVGWDSISEISFFTDIPGETIDTSIVINIDDITLFRDMLKDIQAGHPRLFIPEANWKLLRYKVKSSQFLIESVKKIQMEADSLLTQPVSFYDKWDGLRILLVSQEVLRRVYTLSLTYRFTADKKYLTRLWNEIEAISSFPDWNPKHFLDAAEMTHACAIAYDWLYDAWSKEQREVMKNAIVNLGLKAYLDEHSKNLWWLRDKYNWNFVTNGGIAIGALAVAESHPDIAQDVLFKTVNSVRASGALDVFSPDGAWPESPGYWFGASKYLSLFTAALQSSYGHTFGFTDTPGFSDTGSFPIYVTGPTWRLFNYGDGMESQIRAPWVYWMGKTFDNSLYYWFQTESAKPEALDIVWYEDISTSPNELGLPLDKYFRNVEVATFRSAWQDTNALFVAFKSGSNNVGHSHLDIGEFIVDALGERWIVDNGSEDYNIPNYWKNGGLGGWRWKYYRCRAEGNNTLVINPDSLADQDPLAETKIIKFKSHPGEGGMAVADITDAYDEFGAKRVLRGISMLNNRQQIVVQDEISLEMESNVKWLVNIGHNVETSINKNEVILAINNKKLKISIVSPPGAVLRKIKGEPFETSPNPIGQRESVDRLEIEIESVKDVKIQVVFTPSDSDSFLSLPNVELSLKDSLWPSLEMFSQKYLSSSEETVIDSFSISSSTMQENVNFVSSNDIERASSSLIFQSTFSSSFEVHKSMSSRGYVEITEDRTHVVKDVYNYCLIESCSITLYSIFGDKIEVNDLIGTNFEEVRPNNYRYQTIIGVIRGENGKWRKNIIFPSFVL